MALPAGAMRGIDASNDSMLSRYFRDMATHQVMGPDEELRAAQAVELAESDVTACTNAFDQTLAGCDWVGPFPPGPPAAEAPPEPGRVGSRRPPALRLLLGPQAQISSARRSCGSSR